MNTATKLFVIVLSFILSFGFFFTGTTYASNTTANKVSTFTDGDGDTSEIVCIDGIWYLIIYDADGGIVEVIIISND
jgi:hypothetical protein